MKSITLTEEQAEELLDLLETAIADIEHEPAWPAEEPEDGASRERKLETANAIFDLISEQVYGRRVPIE